MDPKCLIVLPGIALKSLERSSESLEMPTRIVQSKQNARLKQLRRALAQPSREPGALAGIEGPNLLGEALRAGLRIPAVFVARGAEKMLDEFKLRAEVEILVTPKELLNAALATEAPQPVAALIEPPYWTWAHILSHPGTVALAIVLAGLQDPGNLGTILRSAEAFGATGLVSLPGTVSAWNPKAVRASAGSVFRVPLLAASEDECFTQLREAGLRVLTTAAQSFESDRLLSHHPLQGVPHPFPSAAADGKGGTEFSDRGEADSKSSQVLVSVPKGTGFSPYVGSTKKATPLAPATPQAAHQADLTSAVALLIGNEGNGVPANLAAKADGAVTIPCPGPVESLNAAVAASVLLYEASRQRSAALEERRGAHR
jgi:RNA methyltransferase, TrmH family